MEIRAALFDLGGVYYSEGFRSGLFTIARDIGDREYDFYEAAVGVIFSTGYIRGEAAERTFWDELASRTGTGEDLYAKRLTIIDSFRPLKEMGGLIREIRGKIPVGLLTDQTNWLYELHERDGLMSEFDQVINSYEEGYTKREPEIFRIACQRMGFFPEEIIFFDDSELNVANAADFGLNAHLFEGVDETRSLLVRIGLLTRKGKINV